MAQPRTVLLFSSPRMAGTLDTGSISGRSLWFPRAIIIELIAIDKAVHTGSRHALLQIGSGYLHDSVVGSCCAQECGQEVCYRISSFHLLIVLFLPTCFFSYPGSCRIGHFLNWFRQMKSRTYPRGDRSTDSGCAGAPCWSFWKLIEVFHDRHFHLLATPAYSATSLPLYRFAIMDFFAMSYF